MSVSGLSNKLWFGIAAVMAITLYLITSNKKPKRKKHSNNDGDDHTIERKSKTDDCPNKNQNVDPNILLKQETLAQFAETDEDIFEYMLNENIIDFLGITQQKEDNKPNGNGNGPMIIDPFADLTNNIDTNTQNTKRLSGNDNVLNALTANPPKQNTHKKKKEDDNPFGGGDKNKDEDFDALENSFTQTLNVNGSADAIGNNNKKEKEEEDDDVDKLQDKNKGDKENTRNPEIKQAVAITKTTSSNRSVWCIGKNMDGQFGIGNKIKQTQLIQCDWSQKIQTKTIYAALHYTVVEDMDGNYYSAGWNQEGSCTVNDKSKYILNMTPITYFKENNIKISRVFVNNAGDAPFWQAEDGSIYTSCKRNYHGRVGGEVDEKKCINKIPFLSQLSIRKMVSGWSCSIAICNDGSVYSTGTGYYQRGENGLGEDGVDNRSWRRIECLKDIIDCDFGGQFVIFLSSSGHVFSAGINDKGQLGLNTTEYNYSDKKYDQHIMRNPTEIKWFRENNPNSSKYVDAMAEQLRCFTQLSNAVVDVIMVYLPSFIPIHSISCCQEGVVALDCIGNVYQWGNLTGCYGDDILCPQEIKLEQKITSIDTGTYHYICRAELGQFISIACGDDGECCRDNMEDKSPQIINGWILNQINSKEAKIVSVIPRWCCTFILVSNTDGLEDEKNNKKEEKCNDNEETQ